MKNKRYTIVYHKGTDINDFTCYDTSIQTIVKHFLEDNGDSISIISDGEELFDKRTEKNLKNNIYKFYKLNCDKYSKKYKNREINQDQYYNVINELNKLKNECTTKIEFYLKLRKYEKSLTNIS